MTSSLYYCSSVPSRSNETSPGPWSTLCSELLLELKVGIPLPNLRRVHHLQIQHHKTTHLSSKHQEILQNLPEQAINLAIAYQECGSQHLTECLQSRAPFSPLHKTDPQHHFKRNLYTLKRKLSQRGGGQECFHFPNNPLSDYK